MGREEDQSVTAGEREEGRQPVTSAAPRAVEHQHKPVPAAWASPAPVDT